MPVRIATRDDAHAIARVHVTSWQTSYRGIVPEDLLAGLSVEKRALQWSGRFTSSSEKPPLLVAQSDDEIVGFSEYGASRDKDVPPNTMELYAIYLLQDFQRRGFGRGLWEESLKEIRKATATAVRVWVLEDNTKARGVYEKMGFVYEGKSKEVSIGEVCLKELRYRFEV